MKRLTKALILAITLALCAVSVSAEPAVRPYFNTIDHFEVEIKFGSDTDDSAVIPTGAICSVSVVHSGSGTVQLWMVPTATTAASSGTQVGSNFTASTTGGPTTFTPGLPYLKAKASVASSGTVMKVRCSNTQVSSTSSGSDIDSNNDGLYEFATAAKDWDGDGTTWKTCDCGGTTTPGFTAGYICGTYRTSATDDTPVDYSSDDGSDNPAECRFEGERIWDDITDDVTALDSKLAAGATVYFPTGTYPMKSTLVGAGTECWNSATEDYSQTCPLDENGTTSMSGVMMRKDDLTFTGAGADSTGERDLKRDGTWMLVNRGLETAWATSGGGTVITGGFCMGYLRTTGACGQSVQASGNADILLNIEKGFCADSNGDGTCDNGSTKTNIDIDTAHILCVDDADGFATDMEAGEYYELTMRTLGDGLGRTLVRVGSKGSACGSGSEGLLVSLEVAQITDDLETIDYPQPVPYQVYGSQSSDAAEAAKASTIQGPLDIKKWTTGLEVSHFTFAHHNYIGEGVCTDGTQSQCDNGPLIHVGSGSNFRIAGNTFVHSNTTYGSGGAVNLEPFSINAVVEENLFAYGTGSALIDISNQTTFRRNTIMENVAYNDLGPVVGGSPTAFNRNYLIRNQGMMFKIEDNRFERNAIPFEHDSALIEIISPFGDITGNTFQGSPNTAIYLNDGAQFINIANNHFDVGTYRDDGGSDDDEFGFAIKIDNDADIPADGIVIDSNRFMGGGRFTGGADTGEAIGNIYIQIRGGVTPNITLGDIGPSGIIVRDNFAMMKTASDSALIGIRGCDDPDNASIYVDGNILTTGRIAFCIAMPAGNLSYSLDTGANGGTDDDGVGLVTCGANRIAGTWFKSRVAAEGGRSNPSECAAAW